MLSFYQYNSRNQLTTLSGDGFIASYKYNGDGLCCAKTVVEGNQTTQYICQTLTSMILKNWSRQR